MKILLVSTNFSPELTGIGKYSGEMADWLSKNGHEVRVICAPPYYPEWKIAEGFSAWKYQFEHHENLDIIRCPIWVPRRPSGFKRLIHLASFGLSSLPIAIKQVFWRPDAVICVKPILFSCLSAIVSAKLSGAKSVLHIQDFEVDAAFELGLINAGWLKRLIYRLESFLYRRFDRVSTISEAMMDKLPSKKLVEGRYCLFPNWVDTDFIHPLPYSSYHDRLNIPEGNKVALYSGNMGEKQGLEIVIDAARSLQDEPITFIMCGSGSAKERLQEQARFRDNIIWLDLQPYEQLNDFLNVADIHLLPQQAGAADLVMPSKLTGMLSSGSAIVATADTNTQVEKVVKHCGLVVPAGDSNAFSDAILQLARDDSLRQEFGSQARNYAEQHLKYSNIMNSFNQKLNQLVVGS